MSTGCITTWVAGDYTKGTAHLLYCIASKGSPFGMMNLSHTYTTDAGARRAARRQGLTVLPGVAQGHEAARKKLGLPPSPEFLARALRHKVPPHHSHKFLSAYPDSFAA